MANAFQVVFAAGAVVLSLSGSALAQKQIPDLEHGESPFAVEVREGKPVVIDTRTGETVVAALHGELADDYDDERSLKPTISVQLQPRGYDVIYRFTNNTARVMPMGRLRAGGFNLGRNIQQYDFQYNGEATGADYNTYIVKAKNYPAHWYSPAWVISNEDYAVGVTLQYPMLEYKHDVRVSLTKHGIEGGPGWEVEFRLSNLGDEGQWARVLYPNDMRPGESRMYVVSVRVQERPDEWIRTMAPYREFFRHEYGGVQYDKDPRPVWCVTLATSSRYSATNRYAWVHGDVRRPDIFGWGPWATALANVQGWERMMLWKPTGQYYQNRQLNMPCQFTSQWLTSDNLRTAIDPNIGFPRVAAAGKELGLWWGHACWVSPEWDSTVVFELDPENPEHVALGMAEFDLAYQAGSRCIGLDSYHHTFAPVWNLYRWIEMMNERHAGVKFISEPMPCDVMHTITGGWLKGWSDNPNPENPDAIHSIHHPHYLADFLLPGHETWAGFRYTMHRAHFGLELTPELLARDMDRFAAMGYVPCIFTDYDWNLTSNHAAADSWLVTVPEDLHVPIKWNKNYDRGGLMRLSDGSLALVSASGVEEEAGGEELGEPEMVMMPQGGDRMIHLVPAGGEAAAQAGGDQARNRGAAVSKGAGYRQGVVVPRLGVVPGSGRASVLPRGVSGDYAELAKQALERARRNMRSQPLPGDYAEVPTE